MLMEESCLLRNASKNKMHSLEKMSQESQDREKLLKLLAQSEDDVALGRLIRQKDLFDYLERGVAGPASEALQRG